VTECGAQGPRDGRWCGSLPRQGQRVEQTNPFFLDNVQRDGPAGRKPCEARKIRSMQSAYIFLNDQGAVSPRRGLSISPGA